MAVVSISHEEAQPLPTGRDTGCTPLGRRPHTCVPSSPHAREAISTQGKLGGAQNAAHTVPCAWQPAGQRVTREWADPGGHPHQSPGL